MNKKAIIEKFRSEFDNTYKALMLLEDGDRRPIAREVEQFLLTALSDYEAEVKEFLPKKKKHSFTCIKYNGQSAMCDCSAEGWNLCIDTILSQLKTGILYGVIISVFVIDVESER